MRDDQIIRQLDAPLFDSYYKHNLSRHLEHHRQSGMQIYNCTYDETVTLYRTGSRVLQN